MADQPNVPDGTQGKPDGEPTNHDDITAQLAKAKEEAEALRKQVEANKSKLDDFEKLKTERDKAKEAKRTALAEQGEYKALAEQLQKDNEDLKKSLAEYEGLKDIKTKYEDLEKQTREQLLAQIPEDKRENVKGLDLTALRVIVDAIGTAPKVNNIAGGFSNGKGTPITEKMYDEYTPQEIKKFMDDFGSAAWTAKVTKDERLKLTKKV